MRFDALYGKDRPGLVKQLAAALRDVPAFCMHADVAAVAFDARRHAKTLEEALAAHSLLRLVQMQGGQHVQAPGTPPDPGLLADLLEAFAGVSFDALITMAEGLAKTGVDARVYLDAEERRIVDLATP
jgi:hypothetical protein